MDEKETWNKLLEFRKKETRTKGVANTLKDDEVATILGLMDFFGASQYFMRQANFDLRVARYRLFDWIAMLVNGRWHYQDGDENNKEVVRVLAHSYLKSEGDVDNFIKDLRVTDYQIDNSYERITL